MKKRNIWFYLGCTILGIIIIIVVVGPLVYPVSSSFTDLMSVSEPPSAKHPLGTDETGRDIMARLFSGGRITLYVGLMATIFRTVLGLAVGAVAGYYGGFINQVVMRTADVVMCFPFYILAISLAAILGPSTTNLIIIIVLFSWPSSARLFASEIKDLQQSEFITYFKLNNFSDYHIILRHIIPNIKNTIVSIFTLSVSQAVLMESSLSFLGLGVQPPSSSWGMMLSSARNMISVQMEWWLWLPAGIMVFLTVFSVYLIGENIESRGV
ncbi:ABC transporter permease [Vagococcus vulneris]|uniref:ABC transmembrane type-1 domain-containing protein n=1 Tax=Vagococcus vulneris TaxID=1977869 RepID=A0A430A015_9ENTE|nr:ABC transporter permease [Vagococcus vulneris]RST99607.1 hypothetical protein CBF37_04595 [Vagococcus vulneris]